VLDVAAGARTTYLLLEDGTVWAMGWGMDGELGCAEPCPKPSEKLTPVAGVREATQLAASGKVAFAVHRDGSVTQWGGGAKSIPGKVDGVSAVVQLSAGGGHVLARTARGSVLAWGKLAVGRIYYDDPVELPHEVPGLSGVISVVATGVAAALKDDGTVWVWGNNQQAQFGNGRREVDDQSRVPIRVPGVANVTALAGAEIGRHFLALRKDGTIVAWGNTDWGQVGNGVSGREQATPVALRIARVQSVFAAGNNSFALLRDGSLWMWGAGANYAGEWPLPKNSKLPVQLDFATGVAPAIQ
jgi:alpha-tubulin suppressor-like RCC1 family protein